MPWLLKSLFIGNSLLGLTFALCLLLDWLSGKIEVYINKES